MPDTSGAADLSQPQPAPGQQTKPEKLVSITDAQTEYKGLDPKWLPQYAELVKLRDANQQAEIRLSREGAGIQPWEPQKMLFLAFLDMIWPIGSPDGAAHRLDLDLRFQRMLYSQWDGIMRQVSQARLAAGSHVDPAMLKQMMDQQVPPGLRNGAG